MNTKIHRREFWTMPNIAALLGIMAAVPVVLMLFLTLIIRIVPRDVIAAGWKLASVESVDSLRMRVSEHDLQLDTINDRLDTIRRDQEISTRANAFLMLQLASISDSERTRLREKLAFQTITPDSLIKYLMSK